MLDIIQGAKDYWGKNEYKLTAFLLDKKAPFALICPGGGYFMTCSCIEGKPYAKKLNKLGYSAFVLQYRTKEKARFPAPMDDLAYAVKHIIDNADTLNIEKGGWSLWGSSAGGHLAASYGTDNIGYKKYNLPAPAAIILSYPVITMGELAHTDSRKLLLGEGFSQELAKETSVEKHIHKDYPPTFVWCSKTDDTVNYKNSEILIEKLDSQGIENKFLLYPSGKHGSGLAKGSIAEPWFEDAVEFWERVRSYENKT